MSEKRISIAVAALGGQGGGVLSNWIVEIAEGCGYRAQYTAIAGVAQRTGTTIYAIELYPEAEINEQDPVLSLMPVSGDVDVVIAAELMEAGRAVNRGIVTPEKTTLIASDHRIYAIGEKETMGDGRLNGDDVRSSLKKAAKNLILFDMDELVLKSSSVISSVLFGALAGSGTLPFPREAYEETIRKSGRAVETNLNGFDLGFTAANGKENKTCTQMHTQTQIRLDNISQFPNEAQPIITYGVHKLVDYQDADYANDYLEKLSGINDPELLSETARHLALWMCFEDVIRVADLKTRAERSDQIATEVRAQNGQIWYGYDYFHPRYEEFCDTLPERVGKGMRKSGFWKVILNPFFNKGRIIRPKTILGYLLLRFVANLRWLRRSSLRFKEEHKRINAWLDLIKKHADNDLPLALEIAKCPRLIKGYGETHARGINRFSRIMASLEQDESLNAAAVLEFCDAALLSEKGTEFNQVLNNYQLIGLTGSDTEKGEFTWAGSS